MFSRFYLSIFSLYLVAAFATVGCKSQKGPSAGGPPPPVPVSIATAEKQQVPVELKAVGTVEASSVIQVRSRVAGELVAVHFAEGANVNKGDLLFEIDPRPYQEAIRQAESSVIRDTAILSQTEANLARDRAQATSVDADAARAEQLSKQGIISRSQHDQSLAASGALKASIRADMAAIESARAAIESDRVTIDRAKLDLTYCRIYAPESGRVGNLLVHQGNLVSANSTPLVVVNRLEPIWVSFGVPEQNLAAIRRNSASRSLPVQASLDDQPGRASNGVLQVIDNTVDSNSGTIHLKAVFDNKDHVLWPGQFVQVTLTVDTRSNAILIPSEAVQPGAKGPMVYVVKPDQTVEPRNVTVGPNVGKKLLIETGVAAGENVVTDGQLRLFPGARIQPVEASKVDSHTL